MANTLHSIRMPVESPDSAPVPRPVAEAVSAWMDGETCLADDALDMHLSDAEVSETWHRYHVIGDALRAGAPSGFACSPSSCSTPESQVFASRVVSLATAGTAASVVEIESASAGQSQLPDIRLVASSAKAANDAVFRWKLVAGFASMAAVSVMAWSLMGVGMRPQGDGAVLARAAIDRPAVVAASEVAPVSTASGEPVWVSTPQGVVMRDPRLEELMRTHRQAGGGAAFQVPAGFLRAATHDSSHR